MPPLDTRSSRRSVSPAYRPVAGRFAIAIFREGRFLRAIGLVKRRATVGSSPFSDIHLDDPGIPEVWGTIADRGVEVVLEPLGEEPRVLPLETVVEVGPFALVRVPVGIPLEELVERWERSLGAGPAFPMPQEPEREEPTDVPSDDRPEIEPEDRPVPEVHELELLTDFGDLAEGRDVDAKIAPEATPPRRQEDRRDLSPPPPPPPPSPVSVAVPSGPPPREEAARSRTGAVADEPLQRMVRPQNAPAPVAPPAGAGKPSRAPAAPAGMPMPRPAMAPAPLAPPMQEPARKGGALVGGLLDAAFGAVGAAASMAAPAAESMAPAGAEGAAGGGRVVTTLERRTTVRHYHQMNPGRTYPLLVIISAGKVERIVFEDVAQVESATGFAVTTESPLVRIEPVLPGCALAPASIELDCTAELAEARFHVTPIVEGWVEEARVEVRHEGRLIDTVPIPTRVAKQTVAKVSATFSACSPIAMQLLKLADRGAVDRGTPAGAVLGTIQDMAAGAGGPMQLGLAFAAVGMVIAALAYLRNRPQEAAPIVRLLDYSTQLQGESDLAMERLKARLVIVYEGLHRVIPITRRRMEIGRAGVDIVIDHPSIAARHAEIVQEAGRLVVKALGQARLSGRTFADGRIVLAGNETAFKVGNVPVLYLREARDDAIDGEAARRRLVEELCRRFAGREVEVRAAFADADRPVRGCALALFAAGRLDVETWQAAVAAAVEV